ncbi:carotenoid cleavage dioxygenase 4 [Dionaea muscipula]
MEALSSFVSATTYPNLLPPPSKSPPFHTSTRPPSTHTISDPPKPPQPSKTTTSTPPPAKESRVQYRKPAASTAATLTPKNFSVLSMVFDALEEVINTYIDPPSIGPTESLLSGNFAPVDELQPTECRVIDGAIPECLEGAYIRNGPNPRFLPTGPYHPFDGDGMLHCLRISAGRATFSCRYVRTNKYVAEERAGTKLTPHLIAAFNGLPVSLARGLLAACRMRTWQFDASNGIGLANTSVALLGGKLYALCEFDLPYQIRVTEEGDVETVGRRDDGDFVGNGVPSMTAHPKVDHDTGEVFAFRYSFVPPFLTYFRFDARGNKLPDVPIHSMQTPCFLHDFVVTNKYAVFPDIQIGADPLRFLVAGGSLMEFNSGKVPRLGVIPRYAEYGSEMRWFNVPGFNIFHVVNGWDEIGEDGKQYIVLIAPNILSIEHGVRRLDLLHGSMEMVKINIEDGTATRKRLSTRNLELPVINPAYSGRKCRYVYAGVLGNSPTITGVVKLDVAAAAEGGGGTGRVTEYCTVAKRMFRPGCYGGEVFFVARDQTENSLNAADEDDGYLVSYIHDEMSGESRFIVMDARSPELDIVASVKLPQRVPYGFHGLFVKEMDLRKL